METGLEESRGLKKSLHNGVDPARGMNRVMGRYGGKR